MTTKQRKLELVKGQVLVVGVDIGKLKHFACLRGPGGMVVKGLWFANDRVGFERLWKEIDSWVQKLGLARVVVGLEPTGQPFGYWWEENIGPVVLVNPLHTKRAKELEDNSPLKSDPKDAAVISGLVAEGKYLECHLPRGVFATLRDLVTQRKSCRTQESRLMNQLHQSVERIFPEIERAFSSLAVKSCQELLLRYADPEELAQMSAEDLSGMLRKWSRGRLHEARAATIIQLARESVGIREGKEAIKAGIQRLIRQLRAVEEETRRLEDAIVKCLKETPGAGLLLSVPDFGPLTVAAILAHTGDLSNYEHPDQVIKLAGLNLYEISSGQHKGRVRITKRGRSHFRKILYMAALRASRRRGSLCAYYRTLKNRGLEPVGALVAVMRKLVRVSWALVRKSQSFDAAKLIPQLARAA